MYLTVFRPFYGVSKVPTTDRIITKVVETCKGVGYEVSFYGNFYRLAKKGFTKKQVQ